ncbi:MAG TPA: aldo/keto reductase [Tepidisphaeraceae bacterium]|nr:aldo/keto reductase [Tepidisphaeraceae bacterium]
MSYSPAENRYDQMTYRRCGHSGLLLPAVSLGAWETFGGYKDEQVAREVIYRAFDLGVTHFDFANNYGKPPGNAELVCGRILKSLPRDEMIISSKAGYRMWPGPYGEWGSRKYLIASCDQSLKRMGVDYFDLFYSHRPDPDTPLEETLGALDTLVKHGKALYAGVSSYIGAQFSDSIRTVQQHGWAPITIHQPYYNLLARKVEWDLLPQTERFGTGVIAFAPLASGLLTDKFLDGEVSPTSRAATIWPRQWVKSHSVEERRRILSGLNDIARQRGQSLAQMAIAWVLRLPAVTSALIGASSAKQLEENIASLKNLIFSAEELKRIDALTWEPPA